jgi:hypothetical protein
VEEMSDFLIISSTHSFVIRNPKVLRQVPVLLDMGDLITAGGRWLMRGSDLPGSPTALIPKHWIRTLTVQISHNKLISLILLIIMGHSGESRNPGGYWIPVEDPVFIGDQVQHEEVSLNA